ncbi:response regulator [Magnetofaba australis]|uniref:Sensory/regulatory protein RpfC n=1 Tax=Magnetofaba australis IT-1 TaxID=1434232 RepID=A0A1Y2K762_9PROT|nr:response regulator [Magnetofaba australis]OSM06146.1 putative diguanylate cyclase [Magnetofaba australis IT-1]
MSSGLNHEAEEPFDDSIRVLLVDDQESTAVGLRRMIGGLVGLQIEYCADPLQAVARIQAFQPTVILLDIQMARQDGITLLIKLRGQQRTSHIPIIMLSVEDNPDTKAQAFAMGANDYLVKLPASSELLARLQHHSNAYINYCRHERSQAKLSAQSAQIRAIVDSALDAIVLLDEEGGIQRANPAAATLFELSLSQLQEMSFAQLVTLPGVESDHFSDRIQSLISRHNECLGIRANGSFTLEASISPMRLIGRNHYAAHLRDITLRKSQEAQILAFNRTLEDQVRTRTQELQTINTRLEYEIEARRAAQQQEHRALEAQNLVNQLLHIGLTTDPLSERLDAILQAIINSSCLPKPNGGAVFILDSVAQDLKLMAHHGLSESAIAQCANVPSDQCASAYPERSASGQVELMTCEISCLQYAFEQHNVPVEGMKCIALLSGRRNLGVLVLFLDPRQKALDESHQLLLDSLSRTLAILIDRDRVEVMERDKLSAEAANHAKSAFLATMSHEIRTPINTVLGLSELLLETRVDEEQYDYLQTLHRAGETLLAVINDILDLSKIEAGQLHLENTVFNPRHVLARTLDLFLMKAREKGVALTLNVDERVPMRVLGDSNRLRQVVMNLVSNAIKFTQEGNISVEARPHPDIADHILFSVQDTGIGIASDKQQSIFEPFVQAESATTRRFGGTGLGLSICRQLIEKMSGEIHLSSNPDEGSRFLFHLLLPAVSESVDESEQNAQALADAKTDQERRQDSDRRSSDRRCGLDRRAELERRSGDRRSLDRRRLRRHKPDEDAPILNADSREIRLLLVDDTEDNRTLIRAFLKNVPLQLSEAVNGQEAFEQFQQNEFDLVFMDVQMPIMDGHAATRAIRAWEHEQKRAPTPIVAFTAFAMQNDVNQALDAGCNMHLTKPISKNRLLEVVKELTSN